MTMQPARGGEPGPRRRRYAGWLALIVLAILTASAGPLYLLYRSGDADSARLAFGDAFAGWAPASVERAAAEPAPVRTDSPALPVTRDAAGAAPPSGDTAGATPPSADAATDGAGSPPAGAPAARAPRDSALERARAHTEAAEWDAALRAYDALVRARPADTGVAIERARVLAWSGNAAAGAAALAPIAAREGATAELRLEQANFLWWAGEAEQAEALLSALLAAGAPAGAPAGAEALRATVRASLAPTSALARRWLAERASPETRLMLARALVREGQAGAALGELRQAVDAGAAPRDSLLLELASVAVTADSMAAAAHALEQYLRETGSTSRHVRLRLARAHAWAGATETAIEQFSALLAEAPEPELFLERAQLYAAVNELALADADLKLYLAVLPGQPDALALRAEIARWRTPPAATASASPAPRRLPWTIETESFGDSEAFRWHAIEAHHRWAVGRTPLGPTWLGVSARHEQTQGVAGPDAGTRAEGYGAARAEGYGAALDARAQVSERVAASAGFGLRYFTGAGTFAAWALGADARGERAGLQFRYEHEPAVRRAATAAALEAGVQAHRLRAAADARFGGWLAAGQLEGERLGSGLGTSRRLAGGAWLGREPRPGLAVSAGMSALATAGDAPVLPDARPLYWMPSWYVAPALSLRYEAALGARVTAAARATPSYAFVAERAGAERRFPHSSFAASGLGMDVDWALPDWRIALSADWSGALEAGYRAAALRVRITPHGGQP